jgi:hypothetical protein
LLSTKSKSTSKPTEKKRTVARQGKISPCHKSPGGPEQNEYGGGSATERGGELHTMFFFRPFAIGTEVVRYYKCRTNQLQQKGSTDYDARSLSLSLSLFIDHKKVQERARTKKQDYHSD